MSTIKKQFRKTKLCPYQQRGFCYNGPQCSYAHNDEELQPLPDLRQTKMCEYTKKNLPCPNYPGCSYAHDVDDLRPSTDLATFKTSLCFFWRKGRCFNGTKCRFAHGINEMRTTQSTASDDTCQNSDVSKEPSESSQIQQNTEPVKPSAGQVPSGRRAAKSSPAWQPHQQQMPQPNPQPSADSGAPLCQLPLPVPFIPLVRSSHQRGPPSFIPGVPYPPHPLPAHMHLAAHHPPLAEPNFQRYVGMPYVWGNPSDWQRSFFSPPLPKDPQVSFTASSPATPEKGKRSTPAQPAAPRSSQDVQSSFGEDQKDARTDRSVKTSETPSGVVQTVGSTAEKKSTTPPSTRCAKPTVGSRRAHIAKATYAPPVAKTAFSSTNSWISDAHDENGPSTSSRGARNRLAGKGGHSNNWTGDVRKLSKPVASGPSDVLDCSEGSACLTRSFDGFSERAESESIAPGHEWKRSSADGSFFETDDERQYDFAFDMNVPTTFPFQDILEVDHPQRLSTDLYPPAGSKNLFGCESEASSSVPHRSAQASSKTGPSQEPRSPLRSIPKTTLRLAPPDYHDIGDDGRLSNSRIDEDAHSLAESVSRSSTHGNAVQGSPSHGTASSSESASAAATVAAARWLLAQHGVVDSNVLEDMGYMAMCCNERLTEGGTLAKSQSASQCPRDSDIASFQEDESVATTFSEIGVDLSIPQICHGSGSPRASVASAAVSPYPSVSSTPMLQPVSRTIESLTSSGPASCPRVIDAGDSVVSDSVSEFSMALQELGYQAGSPNAIPICSPRPEILSRHNMQSHPHSTLGACALGDVGAIRSSGDASIQNGERYRSRLTAPRSGPPISRRLREIEQGPAAGEHLSNTSDSVWQCRDEEGTSESFLPHYLTTEAADWSPFSSNLSMSLSCLQASKSQGGFPLAKESSFAPDPTSILLAEDAPGPPKMDIGGLSPSCSPHNSFPPIMCQSLPQSPNLMFHAQSDVRNLRTAVCRSMPQSPRQRFFSETMAPNNEEDDGTQSNRLLCLSDDIQSSSGIALSLTQAPTPPPGLQFKSPNLGSMAATPPIGLGGDLFNSALEVDSWVGGPKSRSLPQSPNLSFSTSYNRASPTRIQKIENMLLPKTGKHLDGIPTPAMGGDITVAQTSPTPCETPLTTERISPLDNAAPYHSVASKSNRHRSASPPSASTLAGCSASPSPPSSAQKVQSPFSISPARCPPARLGLNETSIGPAHAKGCDFAQFPDAVGGSSLTWSGNKDRYLDCEAQGGSDLQLQPAPQAPSPHQTAGAFESCPLSQPFDGVRKTVKKGAKTLSSSNSFSSPDAHREVKPCAELGHRPLPPGVMYVEDFEASQRQALGK